MISIIPSARPFEHGISSARDLDRWTLEGFPLRALLAKAYDIVETRIDLPADLDGPERYDASAVLAASQPRDEMTRLMHEGIERHFHITVTRETRPTSTYVLTAPDGLTAITRSDSPGGGLGAFTMGAFDVPDGFMTEEGKTKAIERLEAKIAGFGNARVEPYMQGTSASAAASMDVICLMLERRLNRPVIDETNASGHYDIHVRSDAGTNEEFLRTLEAQFGLVATPATRDITTLVVRRR